MDGSAQKDLRGHNPFLLMTEKVPLVTASKGEKKYVLPFTFSDMNGVLKLASVAGLRYQLREEITERTTDLVLESIIGAY